MPMAEVLRTKSGFHFSVVFFLFTRGDGKTHPKGIMNSCRAFCQTGVFLYLSGEVPNMS